MSHLKLITQTPDIMCAIVSLVWSGHYSSFLQNKVNWDILHPIILHTETTSKDWEQKWFGHFELIMFCWSVFSVITHTLNNMKHCLVTGWAKLVLSNQIFNIIHVWESNRRTKTSQISTDLRTEFCLCSSPMTWDMSEYVWVWCICVGVDPASHTGFAWFTGLLPSLPVE